MRAHGGALAVLPLLQHLSTEAINAHADDPRGEAASAAAAATAEAEAAAAAVDASDGALQLLATLHAAQRVATTVSGVVSSSSSSSSRLEAAGTAADGSSAASSASRRPPPTLWVEARRDLTAAAVAARADADAMAEALRAPHESWPQLKLLRRTLAVSLEALRCTLVPPLLHKHAQRAPGRATSAASATTGGASAVAAVASAAGGGGALVTNAAAAAAATAEAAIDAFSPGLGALGALLAASPTLLSAEAAHQLVLLALQCSGTRLAGGVWRSLLCDWAVWVHTPPSLQAWLLDRLAGLAAAWREVVSPQLLLDTSRLFLWEV